MYMIAWRFVQIAIEGSVQMGRKEEIAVAWQIEEDMIPADPTMIEARAQLKWHGRQWHDGDYGRRAAERRHADRIQRLEEHTSELQSLMRISYAVFCLKKQNTTVKTAIVLLLISFTQ